MGRRERAATQPKQDVEDGNNASADVCDDHHDLAAFPAIHGESIECRRQRMLAYREFWGEIRQEAEVTLARSHASVFDSLWEYTARAAEGCAAATSPLAQQELPMGLIFTGGVNSSEHKQTFAELNSFLKDKESRVARLQPPRDGQAEAGLGGVLASLLCQLSGLSITGPADIEALQAWHADVGSLEGGPLVVIMEDLESWEPTGLCDLLVLLSDAHPTLPLVLLAHISTSPTVLQTALHADAASRVRTEMFRLPSVLARMERVVETVFLSGRHTLMLHQATCTAIDNYFQCHDFTTSSLLRGLQVVLLSHFMTTPLAMLLPLLAKGKVEIRRALSQIAEDSPELIVKAQNAICPSATRTGQQGRVDQRMLDGVTAAVTEAREAYAGWALTIRWLAAAAQHLAAMDPQSFRSGFSVKDLFRLASFPSYFAEGGKGLLSVSSMTPLLTAMSQDEVRRLLEVWLSAHNDMCGGQAELQGLEELAAEAAAILAGKDSEEEGSLPAAKEDENPKGSGKDDGARQAAPSSHPPGTRRKLPGRSRRAIIEAVASQGARASAAYGAGSGSSGGQGTHKRTPGARVAALLKEAVRRFLTRHPAALPGSAVFRCRGGLEQQGGGALMAAPRDTVHRAMQPAEFLVDMMEDTARAAAMEHDTCTAYQLSQLHGEFVNVAEWFTAFSHAVLPRSAARSAGDKGSTAAGKQGKRKRKPAGLAPDDSGSQGGGSPASNPGSPAAQQGHTSLLPRHDKELMLQLAARFTQATSELQHLGYIKPARRQRQEVAERLVFPYTKE